MINSKRYLVLLATVGWVGLAACASTDPEPSNVTLTAQEKGEEVICRRQRVVGSHLPKQVCKTKAQMERERDAAVDSVGILRTQSGNLRSAPPPPTAPPPR